MVAMVATVPTERRAAAEAPEITPHPVQRAGAPEMLGRPVHGGFSSTACSTASQEDRSPPDGCALDIGCGTGDHAVNLAQRRWDVTGVDIFPRPWPLDGSDQTLACGDDPLRHFIRRLVGRLDPGAIRRLEALVAAAEDDRSDGAEVLTSIKTDPGNLSLDSMVAETETLSPSAPWGCRRASSTALRRGSSPGGGPAVIGCALWCGSLGRCP